MKIKDKYKINFLSPNPSRRFNLPKLGILLLVLSMTVGGIVLVNKKGKYSAANTVIPTAHASEIPGWWYSEYFGKSVCGNEACKPESDPDKDSLTNQQEYFYNSNPIVADTNKNGATDGDDVAHGIDPSKLGNVSFDEAASDDSIVGESLVFDQDIKKIITDLTQISGASIPVVNTATIKVSKKNSKQSIATYLDDIDNIYKTYYPEDMESIISNHDDQGIAEVKLKLARH
jgi:hypothetical protein